MKIDNNMSFRGIYYSKIPLPAEELCNISSLANFSNLIEHSQPKLVKDIMEQAPIFRDLDNATDIFVTTMFSKKTNDILGVLYSSFINPYNKKPEALNIQANGCSKEIVLKKIKAVANKLPYYNELKESIKISEKPLKLKVGKEWFIGE